MPASPATADLYDAFGPKCRSCTTPFCQYGGRRRFSGPVSTIECRNDNLLLRQALERPGGGGVLVVDGKGSLQCALLGDMLAASGLRNSWAGVVIYGAVRDVTALAELDFGVKALGSNPAKSTKHGTGSAGGPVAFGDVAFAAGDWLYSDEDGILISTGRLPDLPTPH